MNTLPTSPLSLLLWNANGVRGHTNELTTLLHDKNIDVALITETRLTKKIPLHVTGYQTYRTDHPDGKAHGGTAILIHRTISHHLFPLTSSDSLQATGVRISTSSYPLILCALYCPPNKSFPEVMIHDFLSSLGPRFLVGGDYNAKHLQWGSRITNSRGRSLLSVLSSKRCSTISPKTPTYWPTDPNRIPDLIDFFISLGLGPIHSSISSLSDLSSDHTPLLLTLSLNPFPKTPPPSLTNGIIDWNLFRNLLEQTIDLKLPLKTPEDLDNAVDSFTKSIQQCAWEASNSPTHRTHTRKVHPLPDDILLLLAEKRRARALWQRSRHPEDRRSYNRLCRLVKRRLESYRSESYNSYLSSLNIHDNSLWNATRKILKYHPVSSPLHREDGTWASSDEQKSREFGKHLQKTFTPHPDPDDSSDISRIKEFLESPLPLTLPPKPVSPSEVKHIIAKLPRRKSPGYDLITSEVLRQLPAKATTFLTYMYNCIFRTAHFPLLWKFSIIILFPKPGKPSQYPSSYRPISLLPILSKIFEKLLLKRILPILNSQTILPVHQFGFRSQHSTVQQGFRVVDHISASLERKEFCTSAFLDIAQAFDRVWHDGLLFKLKSLLPSTLYLIIRSYLTDRYFRVRQGSEYSEFYPVEAGVPQGSVLGPVLYILYTADLPTSPDTLLATYADDTAILSSHPDPNTASENLQSHLIRVEKWCKTWRIKINELISHSPSDE